MFRNASEGGSERRIEGAKSILLVMALTEQDEINVLD